MDLPVFYEPAFTMHHTSLSADSAHHALHVLRMKTGDAFRVTDGCGHLYACRFTHLHKQEAGLLCEADLTDPSAPASAALYLAIAFTKNLSRMEWLLEKATEIGVHAIIPLRTARSEKHHLRDERMQRILISAMLQSARTCLPRLYPLTSLKEALQVPADLRCVAHCREELIRHPLQKVLEAKKDTLILIGPEGDFTSEEIDLCLQQNSHSVSLGPHRLRTETAGLYACVQFNAIQV